MGFLTCKEGFDEQGFVVVRDFLRHNQLLELKREVNRFLANIAPNLPEDQIFYQEFADRTRMPRQVHRMNCDPYFAEYQKNTRWLELAETLVGEPVTAYPPHWFCKPAFSNHYTPPHQDNQYYCLQPPNYIMMFLALEDIPVESGCLYYVSGSQRGGLRPHEMSGVLGFSQGIVGFDKESIEAIAVELAPGDIVCHHAETIHWSECNQTDRDRPAFAMTMVGQSCRVDHAARKRYEEEATQHHMLK